MQKLILGALLLVCICAYPHEQDFHLTLDEIDIQDQNGIDTELPQLDISSEKFRKDAATCKLSLKPSQDQVNACVDVLFQTVDTFLANGSDPLNMPDMHSGFNYTLIITYRGSIDLTNGKLSKISTLHRSGDARIALGLLKMNVTIPLSFTQLEFKYDYSAKIMGLGPKGGIEGTVKNLTMEVAVGFNMLKKQLTLYNFQITSSGRIDFKFTGNILVDWLLNLLSDVITMLLKNVIVDKMEDVVGNAIASAVDAINKILAGGNSTVVAPSEVENTVYKSYSNY